MNSVLTYFLATTLLLGLSWGLYRLLLRKTGKYGLNRFYLLGMTVFSLLLPLTDVFQKAGDRLSDLSVLQTVQFTAGAAGTESQGSLNWLALVYFLGLGIGISVVVWRIFTVLRIIRKGDHTAENGFIRVIPHQKIGVSSFFRYLIWDVSVTLTEEERRQLEAHEHCHIRQWHSLDKTGLALLTAVFWFQPFLYLIAREISEIHEFLADRAALRVGSANAYKKLMLRMVAPQFSPAAVHTFAMPTLKNRVKMMFNSTPGRNSALRYFLILPLLAIMITSAGLWAQKTAGGGGEVEMPKFKNMQEVMQKITFPADLKGSKTTHKVMVKMLVGTDGSVEEYEILKETHPDLGAEVIKIIDDIEFTPGTQDGKPVKVWVTVPFAFAP